MKTVPVRDVRNHYAQIMREVQDGETFTVTIEGRPVATISPYSPPRPAGPQTWVPVGEVVGALSHLRPGLADRLRADLDEHVDDGVVDPFERHRQVQAGSAPGERTP
ncbi:type II toxin-antitoxin system Phd/YefM family antitoxin [Kineococcus esterisolvens]|uniref:type II toxin-antitoxin system Phd/YefM family antitoxin n=1 Tax=unclassified Kineococcus TaxID=2621656 RepID=UPI003D7C853A